MVWLALAGPPPVSAEDDVEHLDRVDHAEHQHDAHHRAAAAARSRTGTRCQPVAPSSAAAS